LGRNRREEVSQKILCFIFDITSIFIQFDSSGGVESMNMMEGNLVQSVVGVEKRKDIEKRNIQVVKKVANYQRFLALLILILKGKI
jgi:hypothetical protein